MTTALLVLAAAGMPIGFWLRVPTLIAASGLVALVWLAFPVREHSASALLDPLWAVAALQVGYLIGLMLSCLRRA